MPRENEQDHQSNNTMKERIYQKLLDLSPSSQGEILTSNAKIRETATHDFTAYEFLYEPMLSSKASILLSYEERQLLYDVIKAAVSSGIVQHFVQVGVDGDQEGESPTFDGEWFREETPGMDDEGLTRRLFDGPFQRLSLPLIIQSLSAVPEASQEAWLSSFALLFNQELIVFFKQGVDDSFVETELNQFLFDNNFWEPFTQAVIAAVVIEPTSSINNMNRTRTFGNSNFTPFESDTVNFGLQLVYRQVWIPLGTQAGEVVKTIPLGPGQTERISIRSLRRKKSNSSYEQNIETESSSEASETSRDSSEVVDQASSTFRWSTDISASANWGWGNATASASLGGDKSNATSSTKNNLNEAMSKTADKLRTQTKIKVSTEGLNEVEQTQSSEITNANDEVAVTYVYSKLQRQYEIHTYLAEVNTVVFVASPIPTRAEMTAAWFGKHSHILRRVMLNTIFVQDLETILAHNPYSTTASEVTTDDLYTDIIKKVANDGLPDLSQAAGTPPDYIASAMEIYDRDKERGRANKQAQRSYEKSFDRLAAHIEENALHYARAFWRAKDPDTRMMEYANIRVPTRWRYQSTKINYETGDVIRPGGYVPTNSRIESMARLSDIVNPAGPIGYAGNYLAFYLRSDQKINDLQAPLAAMRIPYLKRGLEINSPDNISVYGVVSQQYAIPKNGLDIHITIDNASEISTSENNTPDETLQITLKARSRGQDFIRTEKANIGVRGGKLQFSMLALILRPHNGLLEAGTEIKIHLTILPILEDPELSQLRWDLGPDIYEMGESLFTPRVIAAMSEAFVEVADGLENIARGSDLINWAELSEQQQDLLQRYYPEYLLKERHTRRFLLDTDNVFLSRIVDNNSSLEPFKDVHRNLDILRTVEDIEQLQIETERLDARIADNDLSDPDVQTRTVVVSKDTGVDVNA